MKHQVDHSQLDHSFTANRQRLVVLAKSAIFAKPGKCTFDHPTFGQDHKAMQLRAFDDLQYPMAKLSGPRDELAGVTAVGPNQSQSRETIGQFPQNQFGSITVLDAGRMHHNRHHQTKCIDHQMAFSAHYLLARIVTSVPPFEAVLTDWLSIIAALGLGWRPALIRTRSWRV